MGVSVLADDRVGATASDRGCGVLGGAAGTVRSSEGLSTAESKIAGAIFGANGAYLLGFFVAGAVETCVTADGDRAVFGANAACALEGRAVTASAGAVEGDRAVTDPSAGCGADNAVGGAVCDVGGAVGRGVASYDAAATASANDPAI